MISRTSQRLAASVEEVKQQLKWIELYAGNPTPNLLPSREGEPDKKEEGRDLPKGEVIRVL
jgi:hypothetical protein